MTRQAVCDVELFAERGRVGVPGKRVWTIGGGGRSSPICDFCQNERGPKSQKKWEQTLRSESGLSAVHNFAHLKVLGMHQLRISCVLMIADCRRKTRLELGLRIALILSGVLSIVFNVRVCQDARV